ncbi:Lrp/AsnC family transcriptional regulator, partial [Candidatus Woesearchaeota archaeon]
MSKKDLLLLTEFRRNSRETLTRISRKTKVPVSTIYDKLKFYEGNLIRKHTTLIDFTKLGFNTKAKVCIKVERELRDELKNFLIKNHNVNSVYKINNGFDFLVEVITRQIKDLEDFIELLEQKFPVKDHKVYYVIDDIKREGFLSNPELI